MKNKEKKAALVVWGGMCILALLVTPRAVWMNIGGLLTAVMGVLPLVGYTLSPASNTGNLSTYEPLDVFEGCFNGAHMEIVSRDVLTGTDLSSLDNFNDYYRFEEEVKAVCWSSLTVWVVLILVILFSVKLAKRRKELHISAATPILIGWMFIALVPYICTVTVSAVGSIHTANAFYGTGLCAMIFFLFVWSRDTKGEAEGAPPEEKRKEQASKEVAPEGWYTCPTCGRLVRDGNRCSHCETETTALVEDPVLEKVPAPVEAGVEEEKPAIRYCRKCGAPLLPDGKFCARCGTKILEE